MVAGAPAAGDQHADLSGERRRRMNAVATLLGLVPGGLVRARLEREGLPSSGTAAQCARRLRARYDVDLVGFLNCAGVAELRVMTARLDLGSGSAGALRQ